jgi:LCP family protein required for cell wall assembly
VLGGDNGFRTDAIIVVGIDPVNEKVSLASIPRDTANAPLPDGGIFVNKKINAFYDFAARDLERYPRGPGRATADLVGRMLGIHIDFYVATSFDGFVNLVNAIHGIRVILAKPVVDPYYQITTTNIGVRFPAGAQTLGGGRALIFVRTRQGDNDFERERRHQLFLLATGRQVLAHPALLGTLLAARQNLVTDFPLEQLPTLVEALASAGSWPVQQVVLGPSRYESAVSCPCGYALQPNLGQMRAKASAFFPWAVAP